MLETKPQPEVQSTSPVSTAAYQFAYCERCDWRFLLRDGSQPPTCPRCFRAPLNVLQKNEKRETDSAASPELVIPFSLDQVDLSRKLSDFSRAIWLAPADLTFKNLTSRLQKIFLPGWLVDTTITATWQADVGFNYQVVSHEERYQQSRGWATEEKQETRVRWENRLGRLQRFYQNLMAPALEEQTEFDRQLGAYDQKTDKSFSPEDGSACICLPDRPSQDAWSDVVPAAQARAAEDCRRAAGGDHIRNFRWSPDYSSQNWTLLLKPVYTTYYLDDDGRPQPVWINGQTGKFSAVLRASMRKAQRLSQRILLVAVVLFLISLVVSLGALVSPFLLGFGVFGISLAAAIGLIAVIPIAMVWQVNRKQE